MFGFKRFNTVIMDGTSSWECKEIAGIIGMVTGRRFRRVRIKPFPGNPSMKVISVLTSAERYRQIKNCIEESHPGLCSYDVKL